MKPRPGNSNVQLFIKYKISEHLFRTYRVSKATYQQSELHASLASTCTCQLHIAAGCATVLTLKEGD